MDDTRLSAKSQAMTCAEGKPECHRLLVTDGLRYGIYVRNETSAEFRLHAYMNLTKLRRGYAILACDGAREAILAMAPEWKAS